MSKRGGSRGSGFRVQDSKAGGAECEQTMHTSTSMVHPPRPPPGCVSMRSSMPHVKPCPCRYAVKSRLKELSRAPATELPYSSCKGRGGRQVEHEACGVVAQLEGQEGERGGVGRARGMRSCSTAPSGGAGGGGGGGQRTWHTVDRRHKSAVSLNPRHSSRPCGP